MQTSWLKDELQHRIYMFTKLVCLSFMSLIGGLSFGLAGLSVSLIGGLSFGLAGLTVGLFGLILFDEKIFMVDKLKWSWNGARNGLLVGLGMGLSTASIVAIRAGLLAGLNAALSAGMPFSLAGGLIGGLAGRLSIEETTRPGRRLKQTLYSTVFGALTSGVLLYLLSGWIDRQNFGLEDWQTGPVPGWVFGAPIGVLTGVALFGGIQLIKHYSMRLVLTHFDILPRHLIHFLDYAVSLIFLRRVGGSYIFIHRLLMEHFAQMDEETINKLAGIDNEKTSRGRVKSL
jgi:hypothetical protein